MKEWKLYFFIQMVKLTFLQLRWKRKMDLGLMAQEYLKHEMVILSGRNKIMGGWDNTSLIKIKKELVLNLLLAKPFFFLFFWVWFKGGITYFVFHLSRFYEKNKINSFILKYKNKKRT